MSFDPAAFFQHLDEEKLGVLVETMLLAADADGELGDDERGELAAHIRKLAAGTAHEELVRGDALERLLEQAQADLARDGRERRLQAVKERLGDADSRKGALGLAIAITAADGLVRTSERELIFDLAEALEIDPDEAADLVRRVTRPPAPSAPPPAASDD